MINDYSIHEGICVTWENNGYKNVHEGDDYV